MAEGDAGRPGTVWWFTAAPTTRLLAWAAALPLLGATLLGTLNSLFDSGVVLVAYVLVLVTSPGLLVCWLVLAGIMSLELVSRRQVLRAACFGLCGVAGWAASPFMLLHGGDYVHVALDLPLYAMRGDLVPWRARRVAFDWGTRRVALGGDVTRTLVYDPTGETRAVADQPVPEDPGSHRAVRRLGGGFFLETTLDW